MPENIFINYYRLCINFGLVSMMSETQEKIKSGVHKQEIFYRRYKRYMGYSTIFTNFLKYKGECKISKLPVNGLFCG